jgi:3-phytase
MNLAPLKVLAVSLLALAAAAASGCGADERHAERGHRRTRFRVSPTVETDPVPNRGDAADDPGIWIHPTDPSRSTIIGTDKKGGLAVYDLAGRQLQYVPGGLPNNVDLRHGFRLGGRDVALVAASDRSDGSFVVYRVDPGSRRLEAVAARRFATGIAVYGCCMYRSPSTGTYYFIVSDKKGTIQQWELFDNGSGAVDAKLVRAFRAQPLIEGCVADDRLARLYLAAEKLGIWRYGAEPTDAAPGLRIDCTDPGGHLTPQVEGLTLYPTGERTGYLIASSQGSDQFVVYARENNNDYLTTFEIVPGGGIDGCTVTDGIDVTHVGLGPRFPAGVFVAHDGRNTRDDGEPERQNYKLVPWQEIAAGASPPLALAGVLAPAAARETPRTGR